MAFDDVKVERRVKYYPFGGQRVAMRLIDQVVALTDRLTAGRSEGLPGRPFSKRQTKT